MILALTVSLFPSCGTEQEKEIYTKDNTSKQIDLLNKNDLDGTFFKAMDQDTLQCIAISKKGIVYSSSKPSQKMTFPFVEPLVDGESRVYSTSNKNESIDIVIYEDETAQNYLDGRFDHSVAVSITKNGGDATSDFACYGHYLYDESLSGNWVFQAYEDKRIEELGIDQIPLICIDINTRSFSGSGGNHMIYGDIRCQGDAVFFKIILSPEYVTDSYQKEKELLAVLDNCDRYQIKADTLFLYEQDTLKLTFARDLYNI
ncbi:hypothetical protein ACYSNM_07800 [Myroides sp. LJL116]